MKKKLVKTFWKLTKLSAMVFGFYECVLSWIDFIDWRRKKIGTQVYVKSNFYKVLPACIVKEMWEDEGEA